MEIVELKPRSGEDVLRSFDNGLIVTDHFAGVPAGRVQPMDYGIILICDSGKAQFEYDGQEVHLNPNDLFLVFARSVIENFMCSPDFNCREFWFSRGEMWDMNMYGRLRSVSQSSQNSTCISNFSVRTFVTMRRWRTRPLFTLFSVPSFLRSWL